MADNIVPFQFESKEIRCIEDNDQTWFALVDILNAMGSSTRASDARSNIEEAFGDGVVINYPIFDALGREQNTLCIPADAVTFLVSTSRTETGKRLRKWIFAEVLPSIRKTGEYKVNREQFLPRQLPPIRDTIEYTQVTKDISAISDPILRSLLTQRLMEELSAGQPLLNGAAQTQVILTVRAKELGYADKQIGSGAQLGKFVSKILPPNGKTQHGKYPVNVYDLTPDLDATIHAYFR